MAMVPGGVFECGSLDAGDGDDILIYDDRPCPTAAECGVDDKHWYVMFKDPTSEESPRQETIKLSLRLLAQVVGKERAVTSLYSVDNEGFGCEVSKEEVGKLLAVDGIECRLHDYYGIQQGVYGCLEDKFPGPDDDLSEYRRYLDDWEAEHGGRVFFPHKQPPVMVKEVDPQESKAFFMRVTRYSTILNSMLVAQRASRKDGFTLVTSKKNKKTMRSPESLEGLETLTLMKLASLTVDKELQTLEALEKEVQALEAQDTEAKRKQAKEEREDLKKAVEALKKERQEQQAKEALEKQAKEKQAEEALKKEAKRKQAKQAKKRAKRKQAKEVEALNKERQEKQAKEALEKQAEEALEKEKQAEEALKKEAKRNQAP